jgi:two-component sensor histidine kinase
MNSDFAGVAWIRSQIDPPLGWRRRLSICGLSIVGMLAVRTAVEPLIGADISFTAFFPIVILSALSGGGVGGLATISAGSVIALAFSGNGSLALLPPDAAARLAVWLISSIAVASVTLGFRRVMQVLRSREMDLQEAAKRLELMVREMEHRGKNALALVEALSRETAFQSTSVDEYRRDLSSKIGALGCSYAFLTRRKPDPILLGALINEVLTVFSSRIEMGGGATVWISPEASLALALVLHELATNAVKHGALSNSAGRVIVDWQIEDRLLKLVWAERGGPRIANPCGRGFGSRLILRAFERLPGGSVTMDFQPAGLVCTLTCAFGARGPVTAEPEHAVAKPADMVV